MRTHSRPPDIAPRNAGQAEGTPVASWGITEPGHAPVIAMPVPIRAPPIMLPS